MQPASSELLTVWEYLVHIAFIAAVCSGEGLDEPTEVNILLSLSECHKCHFQLLNVTETVGVTTKATERHDVYIPAVNIPCPRFSNIKTKSHSLWDE